MLNDHAKHIDAKKVINYYISSAQLLYSSYLLFVYTLGKPMDIVYIRDLRMDAVIGIYEWEKRIKQQININLEMGWDNSVPAASDDIKDTLNYKASAKLVKELVASSQYELVETLAEKIAELLLKEMQIPWIKVQVGKPMAVTDSAEVGVVIERGNKHA